MQEPDLNIISSNINYKTYKKGEPLCHMGDTVN